MVTLLRRRALTVDELAKAVGLTNNGVRAHLATLERDGVVCQRGTVRPASGGGKPAYVYELTPKAYAAVLGRLLDGFSEGLGPEESEALLRDVGQRMAGEQRGSAALSLVNSPRSTCKPSTATNWMPDSAPPQSTRYTPSYTRPFCRP